MVLFLLTETRANPFKPESCYCLTSVKFAFVLNLDCYFCFICFQIILLEH